MANTAARKRSRRRFLELACICFAVAQLGWFVLPRVPLFIQSEWRARDRIIAVGHREDAPVSTAAGGRSTAEPVQQRLTSLMVEVHDLLHRVLPPPSALGPASAPPAATLACGDLALDEDGLTVTESGREVVLTTREVLLLRYLLQRAGRIVTRDQLLTDVWGRNYTGDDRTVDVHVSRLRRKLPSLRGRLVAIRHLGYRLDLHDESAPAAK